MRGCCAAIRRVIRWLPSASCPGERERGVNAMPFPDFLSNPAGVELMRRARANPGDPTPRLVLADWLEGVQDPDAAGICRVFRASFGCQEVVPLEPGAASRLAPLTGARMGWFCGPWQGGEPAGIWLKSPLTLTLPGGVPLELEYIPPGTAVMGSPDFEEGRYHFEHKFTRGIEEPFYLGKYPVTQAQWKAVMGNNPSRFVGDLLPVEQVNWEEARTFCWKLKSLLGINIGMPTKWEWEYACRSGTTTPYHFGTQLNGTQANCDGRFPCGTTEQGPFLGKTTPGGSYPSMHVV